MRLSWKMGRVAGIDLYIHATFLLVFLFVPEMRRGGVQALEAMLLICAVFGCVLLHELGHALMARRFGIGTVDITLYPDRWCGTPGADAAGAGCGAADRAGGASGEFRDRRRDHGRLAVRGRAILGLGWGWLALLGELLVINLGLGLFNLIPAFPMDGGRVLRAALEHQAGPSPGDARGLDRWGRCWRVLFAVCGRSMDSSNPAIHLALAAFIFFAARGEEAHVAL